MSITKNDEDRTFTEIIHKIKLQSTAGSVDLKQTRNLHNCSI